MLRVLVALLLLANLAFYAWTQGWLDGVVSVRSIGDREPERLARQVRPETVRILPAGAASAPSAAASAPSPAASATPATLACLEAGPFSDADMAAAQATAQLALPSGSWVTLRIDRPGAWIVYLGKYANRAVMRNKEDELNRRQLPYEEVRDNPALEPGLSLGRFDQRAGATQAVDRFAQQGLRGARVVELTAASSSQWLRVEKAEPSLATTLAAMKADALGKGFVPCAKAPAN